MLQRIFRLPETFDMFVKRRRDEIPKLRKDLLNNGAVVKASPAVVTIISHGVPAEIIRGSWSLPGRPPPHKIFYFVACGMIIECQSKANDIYLSTVLAPANLFLRPNGVDLYKIKIDVVVGPTRLVYNGQLLACDFHYNLAAIRFKTGTPLQTVTFRGIDDTLSIDLNDLLHVSKETTFQFRPHSALHHIVPGTEIFSIWRASTSPYFTYPVSCLFRSTCPKSFSCSELYEFSCNELAEIQGVCCQPAIDGGPVLNSFGEVIGIIFNKSSFLPSNIVTRWWNHFKSFGEFRRPYLGMEVANLHAADLNFLAEFMTRFPNIYTAVFITKVEEESPAYYSGLRTEDVIIKFHGERVKSKMQFFEKTWAYVGQSVEFNVLRANDGQELNLSLVIEETSPDKFHKWPQLDWK